MENQILQRRKPDPIPAIHPVPEYAVEGERAKWYAEMKVVFQVPWMGVAPWPAGPASGRPPGLICGA